jgi:HPt (histidine-containing phosphotransfer) domain-containing protein
MTDPAGPIDATAFANLVEMTGGEMDFVDELVDTYLDDGTQLIEQLRDAAGSGDMGALVRPVHSLKSSSLNVGAIALGEQCRTLEEAARNGSVPHPAEWVASIATGFDDVRRELLAERARRTAT